MRTDGAEVLDWAMIHGYGDVKRALEVAVSGNLSVLLVGPAGSGKVTLARSLQTILPDAAFLEPDPFIPLSVAIDQVISSRGIFFLENIDRWDERSLLLLRESVVQQPGQFFLIATTGYCPCGNYMDERRECTCSLNRIQVYQKRLRETVHSCFAIEQRIQSFYPECRSRDESSREVGERVKATTQLQWQCNGGRFIGELSLSEMQADASLLLDEPAQHLLLQLVAQLPLPSQQEKYLHQVARTAASMAIANPIWDEPVTHVQSNHVAEACCMRPARYWNQEDHLPN